MVSRIATAVNTIVQRRAADGRTQESTVQADALQDAIFSPYLNAASELRVVEVSDCLDRLEAAGG